MQRRSHISHSSRSHSCVPSWLRRRPVQRQADGHKHHAGLAAFNSLWLMAARSCYASLAPACQVPAPARPALAPTGLAAPVVFANRKQPAGPTWKRRHSGASRHSAAQKTGQAAFVTGLAAARS